MVLKVESWMTHEKNLMLTIDKINENCRIHINKTRLQHETFEESAIYSLAPQKALNQTRGTWTLSPYPINT